MSDWEGLPEGDQLTIEFLTGYRRLNRRHAGLVVNRTRSAEDQSTGSRRGARSQPNYALRRAPRFSFHACAQTEPTRQHRARVAHLHDQLRVAHRRQALFQLISRLSCSYPASVAVVTLPRRLTLQFFGPITHHPSQPFARASSSSSCTPASCDGLGWCWAAISE